MRSSSRGGSETCLDEPAEGVEGAAHSVGRKDRKVAIPGKEGDCALSKREARSFRIGLLPSPHPSGSNRNLTVVGTLRSGR